MHKFFHKGIGQWIKGEMKDIPKEGWQDVLLHSSIKLYEFRDGKWRPYHRHKGDLIRVELAFCEEMEEI